MLIGTLFNDSTTLIIRFLFSGSDFFSPLIFIYLCGYIGSLLQHANSQLWPVVSGSWSRDQT